LPRRGLDSTPVSRLTGQGPVVTDSAGLEIVYSRSPEMAGAEAWTVSPEPSLQIGAVEGESAYLFGNIWGASEASDGRIVVSEGQTYEIRVFAPDGRHLVTFGGRGDGPEEFRGPPWITMAGLDTLVAWDPALFRLSWFGLSGGLIRQVALRDVMADLPISRFPNGRVWQLGPDGSLLSMGPGRLGGGPGLSRSTRRVVLIEAEGRKTQDFGEVTAGQSLTRPGSNGRPLNVGNPFGPAVWPALGPGPCPVALSGEGAWEVRWMDSGGQLCRISRADIPRIPLSRDVIAQAGERAADGAAARGVPAGQLQAAFDDLPFPDSIPAISGMVFDRMGNLWVGRRTADRGVVRNYDVLDDQGRWLASVSMPPEIDRVLEIGPEHLLALWRDGMDVPYVRVYRIRKSGSPP